jgi:dTDP-glucose pyrophosphorylase
MRINLIPMAGEGQRFKNAGYTTPKPLINVNGLPMVVAAAKSLPPADKYIFVCRKQHLENSTIEKILREYFDNIEIVSTDQLTEGQAISCMLARDLIPDDAVLTIGASDNDMTYDGEYVENLFNDENTDGWIWTFRNNPAVLQNPAMYGWVVSDDHLHSARQVSCKIPISNTPLNDHAVIGAFTFKRAKIFFDAVEAMVKANERINNEFYVDIAADYSIRMGFNIKVCEVRSYICWGTPSDYEAYQYWLSYFKIKLHR